MDKLVKIQFVGIFELTRIDAIECLSFLSFIVKFWTIFKIFFYIVNFLCFPSLHCYSLFLIQIVYFSFSHLKRSFQEKGALWDVSQYF